ncbi:MAG: PEGA domain-containing protein [Treponema sp.]|jgi:hypothetical protein|nr:PEGA domain-containing protein [Treponema sp.]
MVSGIRFFAAALFLALVFPSPAFPDRYDETEGSGLFVGSEPGGARVFIDGIERGNTPLSLPSIRNGEYAVRLVKEGYVERRFRVVIRGNSRVELILDLEEARGQVLVEIGRDPSAPPALAFSPELYADGKRVYERTLSLPAGWRTITVEAFGWEKAAASVYVGEGSAQKLELILKPAAFTLSGGVLRRRRFNPESPGPLGSAGLDFEVSGPGQGDLEVLDGLGRLIHAQPLGPFTARRQRVSWNGRRDSGEMAEDGGYTMRVRAWAEREGEAQTLELPVWINSSLETKPLSLASSSPGLLFVSSPAALPALSFQIEGALMGGRPPAQGSWESLPFAAGFRLSLLDNLEAAAAFNAAPRFSSDSPADGSALWGAGASLKWIFAKVPRRSGGVLDALGAAVEISWAWADAGPYTAFGMGTGPGVRLPLLYRIIPGGGGDGAQARGAGGLSLDLLLCPFVLWAGTEGRPEGPIPRVGAGAGALLSYRNIAGGFSFRWDYAPPGTEAPGPGPALAAAEFRCSLSNAVFSLFGGAWRGDGLSPWGAFFGASLGVLY